MPILEALNISRTDKNGNTLLHPVSLTLQAGDKIGISGASGSGKSILLRTLALLDYPEHGTIRFQGQPVVSAAQVTAYRIQTAYLRQQPVMISGTVADNLLLPYRLKNYRHRSPDHTLIHNLLTRIGKDETFLQRDTATLSGGEMQLTALIRVLLLNPQILLLDEPTAALDQQSATAVEALVGHWLYEHPNAAYVWVSHQPEQLARIAEQVWTVQRGHIFQGASPCTPSV